MKKNCPMTKPLNVRMAAAALSVVLCLSCVPLKTLADELSTAADEPVVTSVDAPVLLANSESTPPVSANNVDATTPASTTNAAPAEQPTYQGRVLFNGKAMGGPAEVITTVATGEESINLAGVPTDYSIKFYGFTIGKKYFVALTDQENHVGPDRVWLRSAKVKDIFPNGVQGDVHLYPVVITTSDVIGVTQPSHVTINSYTVGTDVMPDTPIVGTAPVANSIDALYRSGAERYYIKPNAHMTWDDARFALWAYFNPGGVLSNSATWDEAPRNPSEGNPNNFTHTDLLINLDPSLQMKETVTLSFKSASYKPIAVYAPDYTLLASIPDPEIDNLVSTFSVNLQGNHSFVVRAALRNTFSATGGMSVSQASQIFEDMVLYAADDDSFWISNETAKTLLASGDRLEFSGEIKPVIKHPLGVYSVDLVAAQDSHIGFVSTSLSWSKTNEQSDPLGGASFELTDAQGTTYVIEDWVSEGSRDVVPTGLHDSNPAPGRIEVKEVPVGTYTVRELHAPSGYELTSETLSATISEQNPMVDAGVLVNKALPVPAEPTSDEDPQTSQSSTTQQNTNATRKKKPLAKTGDIAWVAPGVCAGMSVIVAGAGVLLRKRARTEA